ncbi:MAG: 50S ribosomal protein L9 [candidate division Zixibacteria bacterium]|nr:50S ribosomal protein L9 [candidate division Zixibacteria bacterium]
MKLILTESIDRLGEAGEVVNVADGYGRNYLLPLRKAIPATGGNLRMLERRLSHREARDARTQHQAENFARKLEEISCTAVVQVGEEDRMFGSVTAQNISEMLKEKGYEIDRRKILLDEPIKALGIYTVPVQVHPKVRAGVKVWVVKE